MLNMSLRDKTCTESKGDNTEDSVVISDTENDDVIFVAVIHDKRWRQTLNRRQLKRKTIIKEPTLEDEIIDLTCTESAKTTGKAKPVEQQETCASSGTEQATSGDISSVLCPSNDDRMSDNDNKQRGDVATSDTSQKKSNDDPVIPSSASPSPLITLPKLLPSGKVFCQTPLFDQVIKYPSLDNNRNILDAEKLKTSTAFVNNSTPNILTGLAQQQTDSSPNSGRSPKCHRLDDTPEINSAKDILYSSLDDVDLSSLLPGLDECNMCKGIYGTDLGMRCQCGQYGCYKCIEKQVIELLSSGQKGLPGCGSPNCKNTFNIDTIAGFVPPMIVNILKKKIEKEEIFNLEQWLKPLNETKHLPDLPDHWEVMMDNQEYQLLSLSPESCEFMDIEVLFHETMLSPRARIQSIKRIQNANLWRFYAMKRDIMRTNTHLSPSQPLERRLFHGTKESNVHSICLDNFDWRLSGVHGTVFGVGSYFAKDASYSHGYTDKPTFVKQPYIRALTNNFTINMTSGTNTLHHSHVMFVAKVLTGRYTNGRPEYRKPPPLAPNGTVSYDSCVDNLINPRIFVVFEKSQCYPEYIIQYINEYH